MTPPVPFELSIGELVLEGLPPTARQACAGAFSLEFERLVLQHGHPPVPGNAEWRLPALTLPARTGDSPRRLGRSLAVALFKALHRAGDGL